MDVITWKKFMDLDDTAPIDEVIKTIDKLKLSFHDTVDLIVKDGDRLGGEYAMLASDAKKLITEINTVNISLKQNQDLIASSAKTTEKMADAAVKNTAAQIDNKKALENVEQASRDLSVAKEKLLKEQQAEAGSLTDLKKQLDAAAKSYTMMGTATSQAIKDDQLKKVTELNKQYTETKKVLDAAKKSTTEAAGSYDALNARVIAAKKELKGMEGSLDGNSKEFKKLQKEVADGTKKLKEWDGEIGDNQRHVGDYKNQIGQLVPGFNNVAGSVDTASKSLLALATNPVGIVLLAIGAALGTLAAYFTRTESGGDKFAEFLGGLSGIFTFLLDQIAHFGGVLLDALSNPRKIFETLYEVATDLKKAIVGVFEDPIPAIKAFGQFLWDQIWNRLTGIFDLVTNLGSAFYDLFTGDFDSFVGNLKDIGNAALQIGTGVEDVIGKVTDMITGTLTEGLRKANELGREIARLKDTLEDQEVALIKRRADEELAVNELLLKSKDKLRFSDEERFKAIKQVSKESNSLLAQEIAAAQTKIAIAQKNIELAKLSLTDAEIPLALLKEQIEAEAALTGLRSQRISQQVRLQKQEISIIREIETEMLAKAKREYDAETNLAKVRADIRAKELQAIANDSRLELEVRNDAVRQVAALQIEQAKITAQQQQQLTKEAALARIELDAETLDQIYNNESLSVAERINLERQFKEEKLSSDQSYVDENKRIQEQLIATTQEVNDKMIETVTKNAFTQLQTDFDELKNDISAGGADALRALNDEFAAGNKTLQEYEEERRNISAEANRQILNDQLDFLSQKANLLRQDGQDTSAIENEIAQVRLKLSQATTDELLAFEKELEAARIQLKTTARDTFLSIMDSQFASEQEKIARQLEATTAQKDLELTLAGDNEEAKAIIANEFAAKEEELRLKQAQAQRKQAIFNKAIAVTEIAINTGRGIAAQLPGLPFTLPLIAIITAIGALQAAAVLARPIPAFAVGVENSPEGLAIVNELGPEIITDSKGNSRVINTDGPTLTYLSKGSKVYTAKETAKILDSPMAPELMQGMKMDADSLTVISEQRHDKELARVFKNGFESMEYAISRNKPAQMHPETIKKAFREALEWKNYLDTNYK